MSSIQSMVNFLFTNVSNQPWIAQNWGWIAGIGLSATILLNLLTRSNIRRSTKVIIDEKGSMKSVPVTEIRGDEKRKDTAT